MANWQPSLDWQTDYQPAPGPSAPPGLNMTKLNELAAEWDPTMFLEAIEKASAIPIDPQPGGAMDMGQGGGLADILGMGPKKPAMPAGMPGAGAAAGLMTPQAPAVPNAPAVAPRGPGPQMQFPGMPRKAKIPSLGDILGGR